MGVGILAWGQIALVWQFLPYHSHIAITIWFLTIWLLRMIRKPGASGHFSARRACPSWGSGLSYIQALGFFWGHHDRKPGPKVRVESRIRLLGGRLVRSGVIYWSQCVEGLIVMGLPSFYWCYDMRLLFLVVILHCWNFAHEEQEKAYILEDDSGIVL